VSGVSADYQEPVDSSMLWVYEGPTEYYGDVLGARSGLRSPELYRENLALYAAAMDNTAGRAWRPLEDTAVAAYLLNPAPDWASWWAPTSTPRRAIWLEADTIIRQARAAKVARRLRARVSRRAGGGPRSRPTSTRM
jgi:predicted metalloprotease with PDZ domain